MDLAKKCQGRCPRRIPLIKGQQEPRKRAAERPRELKHDDLSVQVLEERLMCVEIEHPDLKASRND